MKVIEIDPCPAPRQVNSDRWKKRPVVMRYRAFRDELRLKCKLPDETKHVRLKFVMPMPRSWSERRKERALGNPHQQKPDLDNLVKAFLDALTNDDSWIYSLSAEKIWGDKGEIHYEFSV